MSERNRAACAPSTSISTDHLPARERVDFAREALSQARGAALEIEPRAGRSFRLDIRYRDLGAARISSTTATAYRARRTPALIRRSESDLLCVGVGLRGDGTFDQDERRFRAPAYDMILWDTSRPYRAWLGTRTGIAEFVIMQFPRTMLSMPANRLAGLTATMLPDGDGIGALAAQLLVRLATDMDRYAPGDAARLSAAAIDVFAVGLARALDGDRWLPPETHRHALLVRIHAFVQTHLGDPELSPGMIAAAHHITPRYLHMLFRDEGTTVTSWIRLRRLERCRQDLSDVALASLPVGRIAARWGFSSASHFSHVFRDAYGMPPQEYRQQALGGRVLRAR